MANIYLIGFMGSGKSTVGKVLGEKLGCSFVELDQKIEEKKGKSVTEIFKDIGEHGFRKVESEMLKHYSKDSNLVIACGGGVVLSPENCRLLKTSGFSVLLTADGKTIYQRVKEETHRPLLEDSMNVNSIEEMLSQREENYRSAGEITVDTVNKSVNDIVEEISEQLKKEEHRKEQELSAYKNLSKADSPVELGKLLSSTPYINNENSEIEFRKLQWSSRYYFTNKKRDHVGDKYVWFYLTISTFKGDGLDKKQLEHILKNTMASPETKLFVERFPEEFMHDLTEAGELYLATLEAPRVVFGFFQRKEKSPGDTWHRVARSLIEKHFYNLMIIEDEEQMVRWTAKGLLAALKNNDILADVFFQEVEKIDDIKFKTWIENINRKKD